MGRLMRRVRRVSVPVLCDWAMIDLTAVQRRDLMEMTDTVTIAASSCWPASFRGPLARHIGDPIYSEAILDGVVRNTICLPLNGKSTRPTSRKRMISRSKSDFS